MLLMRTPIPTRSADEAFGATVNALLFQRRLTNRQLGAALGLSGAIVGRKIRGETTWSLLDVMRTATFLNISGGDLLPKLLHTGPEDDYFPALLDPVLLGLVSPSDQTAIDQAARGGIEPPRDRLEGCCSIH